MHSSLPRCSLLCEYPTVLRRAIKCKFIYNSEKGMACPALTSLNSQPLYSIVCRCVTNWAVNVVSMGAVNALKMTFATPMFTKLTINQ